LVHRAGSLQSLQAIILAGLVILFIVGCQGEVTSDKNSQGAVVKREAKGQTRNSGTVVGENGQKPDEITETLGLLTQLVENCNVMLRKLSGRQEVYESANNAQGARLMAQAAENVKDIKSSASSLKSDVQAADNARDTKDEASLGQMALVSHRDDRLRSTGQTDQAVTSDSQLVQEKLDAIEESTRELEANLAEAERCCDLPPGFLDSNLQELHTQTTSVETLTEQLEFEQTTAEPTAPPTPSPTAQPTASPTAPPTAPSTAPATAEPTELR
jgi:cell division septation protein DedD